eukprot:s2445_g27.t3
MERKDRARVQGLFRSQRAEDASSLFMTPCSCSAAGTQLPADAHIFWGGSDRGSDRRRIFRPSQWRALLAAWRACPLGANSSARRLRLPWPKIHAMPVSTHLSRTSQPFRQCKCPTSYAWLDVECPRQECVAPATRGGCSRQRWFRGLVVTSRRLPVYTNKGQKEDDRFNAFHCKRCRTHLVTTDADLANIPRRRTDGAMVLDARLQVISLYTVKREGSRVIRREKGAERQYVHACPSCDQDVGYTSKPHEADLELVYLSDTAVTVPWHRMKSPFTCKVCGYICQSQGQLEFHRKQKQHTEDMEKEQEAANELKPIIEPVATGPRAESG